MNDAAAYRLDLMRTLWDRTYRATIFNASDEYVATIRIILGVPLPADQIPDNAPQVGDYLTVLVEDTVIKPEDIIAFEEHISRDLIAKSSSETFQPTHALFFYPSPSEVLLKDLPQETE